jgi:hypothetical protein
VWDWVVAESECVKVRIVMVIVLGLVCVVNFEKEVIIISKSKVKCVRVHL